MFGYIIPHKSELKVRELNDWQAAYCGVCHAISAHCGQFPRFALQNDMASLAMVIIDLSHDPFIKHKKLCPMHIINQKNALKTNDSLIYCGDVTTLLAHHKLDDMWQDEKKLYAPVGKLMLSSGYKKATDRNATLAKSLKEILNKLTMTEQDTNVSFDIPAALSGDLLYAIAMHTPNICDKDKRALGNMMKNLGMWVYVADAIEDLQHDIKKKCFNPLAADNKPSKRAINAAEDFMTFTLAQAHLAYNLLTLEKSAPIMDNIIRYSLPIRQNKIFSETKSQLLAVH